MIEGSKNRVFGIYLATHVAFFVSWHGLEFLDCRLGNASSPRLLTHVNGVLLNPCSAWQGDVLVICVASRSGSRSLHALGYLTEYLGYHGPSPPPADRPH